MTRLALADDRLPDLAANCQSDRATTNPPQSHCRFGRNSVKRVRVGGRATRGARRFFSAMLRIIAEAKLRRLARELSLRGVRYELVRLEGDRFVADQDRSSSK